MHGGQFGRRAVWLVLTAACAAGGLAWWLSWAPAQPRYPPLPAYMTGSEGAASPVPRLRQHTCVWLVADARAAPALATLDGRLSALAQLLPHTGDGGDVPPAERRRHSKLSVVDEGSAGAGGQPRAPKDEQDPFTLWDGWRDAPGTELDSALAALLERTPCGTAGAAVLFILQGRRREVGTLVVGGHRHAWLALGASEPVPVEDLVLPAARALFATPFGGGAGPQATPTQAPPGTSGRLLLSFSLCVEDPGGEPGGAFAWDFDDLERAWLAPALAGLRLTAEVAVTSQVRYYTQPGTHPAWSQAHRAHLLPPASLPAFVSSDWDLEVHSAAAAWLFASAGGSNASSRLVADVRASWDGRLESCDERAGSSAAAALADAAADAAAALPAPVLHFVAFVPAAGRRPLRVAQGKSTADGFTLAAWGGVTILNPPPPLGADASRVNSVSGSGSTNATLGNGVLRLLPQGALRHFASSALGQLAQLLGLPLPGELPAKLGNLPLRTLVPSYQPLPPQPAQPGSCRVEEPASGGEEGDRAAASGAAATSSSAEASASMDHPGKEGQEDDVNGTAMSSFAGWQVSALAARQYAADVARAAEMLRATRDMMEQYSYLRAPAAHARLMAQALDLLGAAQMAAEDDRPQVAVRLAAAARDAAELCHFFPGIRTDGAVPGHHHLALYLPLLLPISVPILQALLRDLKAGLLRHGRRPPAAS